MPNKLNIIIVGTGIGGLGAAIAMAKCLKRAEKIEDVPALLRGFETIRKPRCRIVQKGARSNGDIWHLMVRRRSCEIETRSGHLKI